MIQIENLTFGYPGNKSNVFENLSLTFKENRIYGLLGRNGMGKSTMLYLISGLLRPKAGRVVVDGAVATDRLPSMLQEMYIVPEEYNMPKVSFKDFITIHRDFYPRFSDEVLRNCLTAFELGNDIDLGALSMGQKKKVYMSLALASCTSLLLMDEPTNGMDIPSKSLFRKVVAQNMSDGSTLIVSTHQVHDLESLLDSVVIVDNSRILLNADVSEITGKYSFTYRQPGDMEGVVYAEPSLQGNASISLRKEGEQETQVNLELLFNAVTKGILV